MMKLKVTKFKILIAILIFKIHKMKKLIVKKNQLTMTTAM
jgi:hypothetical protein